MTNLPPRKPVRRGLFQELSLEGELFVRLLGSRRVNFLLKLIPAVGLLYAVNPADFPGVIDDIVVLIFSLIIFVELCPRLVVDEIRQELRRVVPGEWHDPPEEPTIIDGKFHDADQEDGQERGQKR
jgi:hypothetical protein